jgi:hypothetical protein
MSEGQIQIRNAVYSSDRVQPGQSGGSFNPWAMISAELTRQQIEGKQEEKAVPKQEKQPSSDAKGTPKQEKPTIEESLPPCQAQPEPPRGGVRMRYAILTEEDMPGLGRHGDGFRNASYRPGVQNATYRPSNADYRPADNTNCDTRAKPQAPAPRQSDTGLRAASWIIPKR